MFAGRFVAAFFAAFLTGADLFRGGTACLTAALAFAAFAALAFWRFATRFAFAAAVRVCYEITFPY